MVRPHLEYASPVWSPFMRKEVKTIEDVEKFAMRVITRRWDTGYQELLNLANVPSLESRRLHCAHCTRLYMACVLYSRHCITETQFLPADQRAVSSPSTLCPQSTYHNSFVPHTVNIWNSLPEPLIMSSFSNNVMQYI